MYQNLKNIENVALTSLLVNIALLILLYVGLPLSIFAVIIVISNAILVYIAFKKIAVLKTTISDSRTLLPASVNQAIDMDQYCILMFDKNSLLLMCLMIIRIILYWSVES